jgi:peptidyl-tRNA hydrolase, PTH1 family
MLEVLPKAIIGLGNPEPRFFKTRHNAGFQVIDILAARHGGQWHSRQDCEIAEITLGSHPVLLIKPQTYMNSSGVAVLVLKNKAIQPQETLVIHDELELPLGKLAFKVGGSAKGHNGLKSIIERWGTSDFKRLRFGIGRPANREDVPHFVLQGYENPTEAQLLAQEAADLIEKLYA